MLARIAYFAASICIFCCIAIWVARGDDRTPPPVLTPEQARTALVEWVKGKNDAMLNMALPSLRKAPIKDAGDGWFEIGHWSFNVRTHRFVANFSTEAMLHEYLGRFGFDARSKSWRVEDVSESQS